MSENEIKNITQEQVDAINNMSKLIHGINVSAGWWTDLKYDKKRTELINMGYGEQEAEDIMAALGIERSILKTRNVGELLCLVHSEISEAMEGARKNLQDDKLPHRKMLEVELADAVIRIMDLAWAKGLDLGGAILEKIEYNQKRADHKVENRVKDNGKAF